MAVNWRKIQPVDHGLMPRLREPWTKCKLELDYATYEDVARITSQKGRLQARVKPVAEYLKLFWRKNPAGLLMTVDKAGNNIAFKSKTT